MKLRKILLLPLFVLLFVLSSSAAIAADFDWMPQFNLQAIADPTGFRAKLATRFNIGDAQITAVLSNFPEPADAYVALRLGEMSGKSIEYVTERYNANKGRGWGVLAKRLGIKPGSAEFRSLKKGHDLDRGKENRKARDKGKDKDKGKKDR